MDAGAEIAVELALAGEEIAWELAGAALGTKSGLVPGLYMNNFALLFAGVAPSVPGPPLLVRCAILAVLCAVSYLLTGPVGGGVFVAIAAVGMVPVWLQARRVHLIKALIGVP